MLTANSAYHDRVHLDDSCRVSPGASASVVKIETPDADLVALCHSCDDSFGFPGRRPASELQSFWVSAYIAIQRRKTKIVWKQIFRYSIPYYVACAISGKGEHDLQETKTCEPKSC